MGTFDILNMRINGYDFHVSLMAGNEDWTSAEVKDVFAQCAALLPYHQEGANGRTWQEAAQSLKSHETGMMMLGTFISEQFADALDDLDFFAYPALNDTYGVDSIDAPIDGFMMAADPDNEAGAKEVLRVPRRVARPTTIYLTEEPGQPGRQQQRRHVRLHAAADEGRRADRRHGEHRPVPRPRHQPRVRVERDAAPRWPTSSPTRARSTRS